MSDGSHRSPTTERVRKRASEACTFCRGRKIKCSTERPTCANCKTYGKTCVYAPIQQAQGSRPPKKPRTEPAMTPASVSTSSEPADQAQRSVSRIVVSANGMSSYHGRTSALFEESSLERPVVEHWSKVSEDWVEKGLVAEAARQRQLEQFNFRQGKLDFDGVDPELGMHLLELHWNRQHHSFLLTYRPAFMRDMACAGPYFSKILLNAIYFGASKFSPRLDVRRDPNDVRTAGAVFRERVRELLGSALDKSEVTTIQALLVMTNSLFALGDERSAAWIYAGLAFRMIIDLGMHVDAPGLGGARRFTDEDLEIRRRVFWGAYVVDKIQSLYQGRPVTLTESDTFVPIKFLDSFEEFESWTPFAFSPEAASSHAGCASYSISTFQYLCRLSIILGNILSSIYNERSSEKAPSDLSSLLETLHEKLMAWKDSLPAHLKIDLKGATAVPPNVMSLWALYNVLIILLHRPFVADGHLHSTARSISVNSFVACATAATTIVKILRAYHLAFSVQRAPYLISYATYVAATVHSRIASKRGPGSDAHQSLETCLAVFRENQETNFAVRRADAIVRSLIKRLDVAMPVTEALRIHRDIENTQNTSSPQTNRSGPTSPNDPIFQNLDIDGVIQSFARDQDMMNSAHGTAGEQMGFAVPVSTQADLYRNIPGDHHMPNWPPAEYHGIHDEATFTVDDLLYGFNGELLDSFLGTEWGTT